MWTVRYCCWLFPLNRITARCCGVEYKDWMLLLYILKLINIENLPLVMKTVPLFHLVSTEENCSTLLDLFMNVATLEPTNFSPQSHTMFTRVLGIFSNNTCAIYYKYRMNHILISDSVAIWQYVPHQPSVMLNQPQQSINHCHMSLWYAFS